MPSLVAPSMDREIRFEIEKSGHWTIGRHPDCDLTLDDQAISRYHATLFSRGGEFYLVDHSLNGTLLFTEEADLDRSVIVERRRTSGTAADHSLSLGEWTVELEPLRVVSPESGDGADPIDVHQSLAELRVLQKQKRVPRLVGFKPHDLSDADAMSPILEMVYSTSDGETLGSMGRPLVAGNVVVFAGLRRHVFRFVD